jgi:hypothetical protein
MVVVVIEEGANLPFEVSEQAVIFLQNMVLHHMMPAFDLPLGLRMVRCAETSIPIHCRNSAWSFGSSITISPLPNRTVLSDGFEPVSARTVWLSLFSTKLTPLGESGGSVGLEEVSA